MVDERFGFANYVIRKKVFKLFGGAFHIFDPNNNVVFFSELKAFKLKEDIRIYNNEAKEKEVLRIQARNIIDFSATYDVIDSQSNEKVGALQRKGLKSMFKDEWIFLDAQDKEIGLIQEDNVLMALIRRFLENLIPQNFTGTVHGSEVCEFRQDFNPFILRINLDFSKDTRNKLDRRLGMAAAILLCAIEGRQK